METAKLTIRIDRDELARLQEAAKQDKRSVNAEVLHCIQRVLSDRQQKGS